MFLPHAEDGLISFTPIYSTTEQERGLILRVFDSKKVVQLEARMTYEELGKMLSGRMYVPCTINSWRDVDESSERLALLREVIDDSQKRVETEIPDSAQPVYRVYAGSGPNGTAHCMLCAKVGHVKAHPRLGCGDVGCYANHGDESDSAVSSPEATQETQ